MRHFAKGYYRSPDGTVCGRRYENTFPCGDDVVFVLFAPDYGDEFPDNPDGLHSEKFDLSLECADRFLTQPLFVKALTNKATITEDFLGFSEGALKMVSDALIMGLSMEDSLSMHSARLIPEYLGETYQDLIDRGLVKDVEYKFDGKTFTQPNINKCSLEKSGD